MANLLTTFPDGAVPVAFFLVHLAPTCLEQSRYIPGFGGYKLWTSVVHCVIPMFSQTHTPFGTYTQPHATSLATLIGGLQRE